MDIIKIKKYAIAGILIRIEAEENKLNATTDKARRNEIKKRIEELKADYEIILNDIKTQNSPL